MRIITFGTFDLFHEGHVNLLEYCSSLGNELYVGVSSDFFNLKKKGKIPIFDQTQRMKIIKMVKGVTHVFLEESMEKKSDYIKMYEADVLVMGSDWKDKFDHMPCKVIYKQRTENISTSQIIEKINTLCELPKTET